MLQRFASPVATTSLIGCATVLALSLLTGCGAGLPAAGNSIEGAQTMSGVLHGGNSPVVGATMRLYVTNTGPTVGTPVSAYPTASSDFKAIATTTTLAGGAFSFTLPTGVTFCPAGQYAYVTAYAGSTGATTVNTGSVLMTAVGACSSVYAVAAGNQTYSGPNLLIDEITSAAAAYALGGFMTVVTEGSAAANDPSTVVVNIGAPANNTGTAASAVGSASAAGLAHGFATALSLVNISNGLPYSYTNGNVGSSTGGTIPAAELLLIGNMLQACVNSTGLSTTNPVTPTATANDGTSCGRLYSLTTPPQSGAKTPTNTMAAMLDLARYPKPAVNTWSSDCSTAGSGTVTANTCLFGLAPSSGAAFVGGLSAAPPDWTLAVTFANGYGANTTSTACTATNASCPGLTYPFYVALDYADNVYVLNYDGLNSTGTYVGATTGTNIIGVNNAGGVIFTTVQDTTNKYIELLGTDGANHVFGANTTSATGTTANNVMVYNTAGTSPGGLAINTYYNNAAPKALVADPFNNIYIASYNSVNLRKLAYTASPLAYAISNVTGVTTPPANVYQMGIDANYNLYELSSGTTTNAWIVPNTNASLTSAPTYSTSSTGSTSLTVTGNSSSAAGLGVGSNGVYVVSGNAGNTAPVETMLTTTGSGSTTAFSTTTTTNAMTPVVANFPGNRYASVDGNNWVYSVDAGVGATGSTPQVSGVDVVDTTDALSLGTYKGCYVVTSSLTCGTGTAGSPAAMVSPRGASIDSAGDIWVVSGGSVSAGTGFGLVELIGAAAPSWPGLSLAKTGLPQ